jgi:hypothetical protein
VSKSEGETKSSVLIGLRVVLISSLVLFLLATATEMYSAPSTLKVNPTPTTKSSQDSLIVPGVRIGPLTLGLSVEELTKQFGKGQLRPLKTGVLHLYEDLGVIVYVEDDVIASVSVRSPHFATRGGVKVGDDVDTVLSSLGRDYDLEGSDEDYVLHNWDQGWHVGVEKNIVTYFRVTPPLSKRP